jgi:predicted DNA-binding transcriptional regulator AlpA
MQTMAPAVLEVLTTDQVAQLFGVDRLTILDWARRGKFPKPFRPGHKSLYWDVDVIRDALAGRWPGPTGDETADGAADEGKPQRRDEG